MNQEINHVAHELIMLQEAVAIVEVLRKHETGAAVNIANDSIYVHARALDTFLITTDRRDIGAKDFEGPVSGALSLEQRQTINSHVAHITKKRISPDYNIDLPVEALQIAADTVHGIEAWKDTLKNATWKAQIESALAEAKETGQKVRDDFEKKLMNNCECKHCTGV